MYFCSNQDNSLFRTGFITMYRVKFYSNKMKDIAYSKVLLFYKRIIKYLYFTSKNYVCK